MPWLMKAEPDSRIVKGKDVKFSVDDFENIGTSPWDAKNFMKNQMKVGDQVLFYHSNCKVPVFAIAEVAKEGYPDHTAWDESHPYFDSRTDEDDPTWFMVDVKFKSRLDHSPTLALLKHLASVDSLPEEVKYIGEGGFAAIRDMTLVKSSRLSVQPVSQEAYDAVVSLGEKGGWDDMSQGEKSTKSKSGDSSKRKHAEEGKQTPKVDSKASKPSNAMKQNSASDVVKQEGEDDRRRSKRTRK